MTGHAARAHAPGAAYQDNPALAALVKQMGGNGQWQRVYPAEPGTFDCSSGNIKTIKMNVTL